MSRSRKRVAAHGITYGRDIAWKRGERRRLRRANAVRVARGDEPLIAHEGNIHNWWCSPSDGRCVMHIPPDPDQADAREIAWYRKCLRK